MSTGGKEISNVLEMLRIMVMVEQSCGFSKNREDKLIVMRVFTFRHLRFDFIYSIEWLYPYLSFSHL